MIKDPSSAVAAVVAELGVLHPSAPRAAIEAAWYKGGEYTRELFTSPEERARHLTEYTHFMEAYDALDRLKERMRFVRQLMDADLYTDERRMKFVRELREAVDLVYHHLRGAGFQV